MAAPWGRFGRFASDAVSGATPLSVLRQGGSVDLLPLLWGNEAGSLGETSAILIALCGIFLIWKKAANWRIVVSALLGFAALQTALWLTGVRNAADPLTALATGGVMYGIMFMATDPISASQTQGGRWLYGALIGALVVLIRTFSVWPEGTMFAILLGNMFAPIVDYVIRQRRQKLRAPAAQGTGAP